MSDFDGIDRGTTTSALAMANGPLTAASLAAAVQAIRDAAPAAACGSEERPHLVPTALRGALVRCVSCGENLVALPNGRAMPAPSLADFFKRELPRLSVPDEPVRVPPEFRYTPAIDERARHVCLSMSVGYDWGVEPPRALARQRLARPEYISPKLWRLMRREGRKNVHGRSTRRTDFGSRGVPEPGLSRRVDVLDLQPILDEIVRENVAAKIPGPDDPPFDLEAAVKKAHAEAKEAGALPPPGTTKFTIER